MASGRYQRDAWGDMSDDFPWFVGQPKTLSQNWALHLECNHRDHHNDVVFTVQAFF